MKNECGIFSNCIELQGFIQRTAERETGLTNLAIYCIQERKAGRPVSESDRAWMLSLMYESLRKKQYSILNDMFDFIPDRLKGARLFPTVQNVYW